MVKDICKHPCYYKKAGRDSRVFFQSSDLECNLPLEKRKYQAVIIKIDDKNDKIIDNIKIKSSDK